MSAMVDVITDESKVDWQAKYSEDMEQKDEELRNLKYRLVGVSDLAKHLEEEKEQSRLSKQKISRLEVALVRVENRASSLEKRLKAVNETSGNSSKSLPSQLPGPSRQILDNLMAENDRLKSALNNLAKKGPSGYVTAVKIDQLEDVITRQQKQIESLKEELKGNQDSERSASQNGELEQQLKKLIRNMKMKDEFCSVISAELKKVQDELVITKEQFKGNGKDIPDNSTRSITESGYGSYGSEPSYRSERSAVQETGSSEDWHSKYIELKETTDKFHQDQRSREQRLIKLVSDKQDSLSKETKRRQELENDVSRLRHQLEDQTQKQVQGAGNHYDAEKKELQHMVDNQVKEIESLIAEKLRYMEANKTLQAQLDNLSSVMQEGRTDTQLQHQYLQLQRELDAIRNEADSLRAAKDELQDKNEEYHDHITYLEDKIKQEESNRRTLEAKTKSLELTLRDYSGQVARSGIMLSRTSYRTTGCGGDVSAQQQMRTRYNMMEEVVRDGVSRDGSGPRQELGGHCGTSAVDSVPRSMAYSRAPPPARMPSSTMATSGHVQMPSGYGGNIRMDPNSYQQQPPSSLYQQPMSPQRPMMSSSGGSHFVGMHPTALMQQPTGRHYMIPQPQHPSLGNLGVHQYGMQQQPPPRTPPDQK